MKNKFFIIALAILTLSSCYKDEIEDLEKDVETNRQDLIALSTVLNDLEKLKTGIDSLGSDGDRLNDLITGLVSDIADSDTDIAVLQQEIEALSNVVSDIAGLRTDLDNLKESTATDISNIFAISTTLINDIANNIWDIENLQVRVNSLSSIVEDITALTTELEAFKLKTGLDVTGINEAITILVNDLENSDSSIKILQTQIGALSDVLSDIDTLKTAVDTLENIPGIDIGDLKELISDLEGQLANSDINISDLQDQVDQLISEINFSLQDVVYTGIQELKMNTLNQIPYFADKIQDIEDALGTPTPDYRLLLQELIEIQNEFLEIQNADLPVSFAIESDYVFTQDSPGTAYFVDVTVTLSKTIALPDLFASIGVSRVKMAPKDETDPLKDTLTDFKMSDDGGIFRSLTTQRPAVIDDNNVIKFRVYSTGPNVDMVKFFVDLHFGTVSGGYNGIYLKKGIRIDKAPQI